MSYAILRTVKHTSKGSATASLKHQLRERDTANADPEKHNMNVDSHLTSSAAWADIESRLEGAKMQKGATRCIEYLVTTSNEVPDGFDHKQYFDDAKKWLEERHGKENIVFTSIQYDEKTPHMAAFAVPRVHVPEKSFDRVVDKETGEKRTVTLPSHDKISANHFLDGKKKMSEMQDDFYAKVGKQHGLERGITGSTAKHQDVDRYYKTMNDALDASDNRMMPSREDYALAAGGQKPKIVEDMEKWWKAKPVVANEIKQDKVKILRAKEKQADAKAADLDVKEEKIEATKAAVKKHLAAMEAVSPGAVERVKEVVLEHEKRKAAEQPSNEHKHAAALSR